MANSKRPRRVVVLGNSCAGKTTFSNRLAEKIGAKHIELDALFWESNWKEAEIEIFRRRVSEALDGDSWIVDGNYKSRIRDIVWPLADTFIWLDPSLMTVLRRFFLRSIRRAFTNEVLWGGCRESLRNSIFQRNSLLLWILTTHQKKAKDYLTLVSNPPLGSEVHRLRKAAEIEGFFRSLPAPEDSPPGIKQFL